MSRKARKPKKRLSALAALMGAYLFINGPCANLQNPPPPTNTDFLGIAISQG